MYSGVEYRAEPADIWSCGIVLVALLAGGGHTHTHTHTHMLNSSLVHNSVYNSMGLPFQSCHGTSPPPSVLSIGSGGGRISSSHLGPRSATSPLVSEISEDVCSVCGVEGG